MRQAVRVVLAKGLSLVVAASLLWAATASYTQTFDSGHRGGQHVRLLPVRGKQQLQARRHGGVGLAAQRVVLRVYAVTTGRPAREHGSAGVAAPAPVVSAEMSSSDTISAWLVPYRLRA